jgi:PQQ-dependent dehydrogenase (methanol/ethanol family)
MQIITRNRSAIARCTVAIGLAAAAASAGAGDWTQFPHREWPTFGGDYAQTRFSRLAQINKNNVHQLELKWEFHTGLAPDPFYNFAPVPLIVDGIMYLADPGNFFSPFQSVFAVDAKTGVKLWDRQIALSDTPEARGQKNIRNTRGVAYGDGRIYVSAQDAVMWALDAATGEFVDEFGTLGKVVVGDIAAGYYLTSPPVFVPKSLVPEGGSTAGRDLLLIGIGGGENESRGFMSAYDADTGELLWRFFAVPAPGEPGGDTWPQIDNNPFANPYSRGGAAPWMPPAYDAELGLVIFGTGNAGPDFDGSHRTGANLFANSIVAVDVRNGERIWHFQSVHHDLWDYDHSAPPMLFDVKRKGIPVKAVGAAGKTGWFYILDRRTGEPLIPCPERPVPTATNVVSPDGSPEQPWPTQPFCESDPFVPQGGRTLPSGQYVAPIFTPPQLPTPGVFGPFIFPLLVPPLPMVPVNDQLVEPGVIGGSNWGPTSYNPYLGLAYIQGNVLPMRYTSIPKAAPTPGVGDTAGWWSYTVEELASSTATFTAMDVATGKIRWQIPVNGPLGAYGGSCATQGGLVFVGEAEANPQAPAFPFSYFTAIDARTGERLFRYPIPNLVTIAGPCVTYAIDGKQYVAVAVGGGTGQLIKGDAIYVFGLQGQ